MDFEFLELEIEDKMQSIVKKYVINISKIVAGRANPKVLDSVKINYFDTLTPIDQVAMISVPEARQILIKPYDNKLTKDIVGAINTSSLGINAVDEGDRVRITLPDMTTQKRREMVKSLGAYSEQAKVSIRAARHEANRAIKSDDDVSEDMERRYLEVIQKLTNKYTDKIEIETKQKEKELMTI